MTCLACKHSPWRPSPAHRAGHLRLAGTEARRRHGAAPRAYREPQRSKGARPEQRRCDDAAAHHGLVEEWQDVRAEPGARGQATEGVHCLGRCGGHRAAPGPVLRRRAGHRHPRRPTLCAARHPLLRSHSVCDLHVRRHVVRELRGAPAVAQCLPARQSRLRPGTACMRRGQRGARRHEARRLSRTRAPVVRAKRRHAVLQHRTPGAAGDPRGAPLPRRPRPHAAGRRGVRAPRRRVTLGHAELRGPRAQGASKETSAEPPS